LWKNPFGNFASVLNDEFMPILWCWLQRCICGGLDDVDGVLVRVDHDGPVHHHLHRLHLDPQQVFRTNPTTHLALVYEELRPAGDMSGHAVVQGGGRDDGAGHRRDGAALARHHVRHRGRRVVPRAVRAAHAVQALLVAVVVVAGQPVATWVVWDWQAGLRQC